MGIKQLTKLIGAYAPDAIKTQEMAAYNGRKLAIDASMAIYQFLVAVRSGDGAGGPTQQLTNEAGEVTSHLQGLWYRTLRFLEAGIKPVYVFDGKPPTLKGGELAKRVKMKEKAHADLAAAKEAGNADDVERFQRRTVRMGKEHVDDCKKLLRLMGMPVVEAPCEAEAQCAALAKADKVYAAASEDMDTLTFGAPRLVRRLWAGDAKKNPILEINLAKACAGMGLTMDQFVDVCILAGCDYCDNIKGVAAVSALKLVKSDGSLAGVLRGLDREKHPVPAGVDYDEVRALFTSPEVTDPALIDLKWIDCDEAGILQFLVTEKGFAAQRVAAGIAKLKKSRGSGQQLRMDSFFKAVPQDLPPAGSAAAGKRKATESLKKSGGKLAKPASGKVKADKGSKAAGGDKTKGAAEKKPKGTKGVKKSTSGKAVARFVEEHAPGGASDDGGSFCAFSTGGDSKGGADDAVASHDDQGGHDSKVDAGAGAAAGGNAGARLEDDDDDFRGGDFRSDDDDESTGR